MDKISRALFGLQVYFLKVLRDFSFYKNTEVSNTLRCLNEINNKVLKLKYSLKLYSLRSEINVGDLV
jgi:hypothetical protein